MAIGDSVLPPLDGISISCKYINRNTLQEVSYSGNYLEINSTRFIIFEVNISLSDFDKRANSVLLTMSTLGATAMMFANGALGAIGSLGNHLIEGDSFNDPSVSFDIIFSGVLGILTGFIGGKGVMRGVNDLDTIILSYNKASSSFSRVLTKFVNGGYATAKGARIAISRTSNNLSRAIVTMNGKINLMISNLIKSFGSTLVADSIYSFFKRQFF